MADTMNKEVIGNVVRELYIYIYIYISNSASLKLFLIQQTLDSPTCTHFQIHAWNISKDPVVLDG
jgi:hypothetical protein